jgi:3-deoxy-D-manno-octulosonic-acid transferase
MYHFGIWIASLFSQKAKKWVDGRVNWEANLKAKLTFSERPIWIHCASLGEFEQGRPLIEALKKSQPNARILLTFYSPSGYEIRHNYPLADAVIYLPADGQKTAQKFIEIVNPQFAIFVKYEFWYHYLNNLKQAKIPTYLISAIFRESQPFFKWYGGLHRQMLDCFDVLFLQDKASFDLLEKFHFQNIHVVGDTRIDRVLAIQAEAKPLPVVAEFCTNDANILVCGSTWEADEDILIGLINDSLSGDYKVIIAPHEIHEAHILNIQKKLTVANITYSKALQNGLGDARVLIIDNIGMLAHLYRFGKVAYIGGGFGSGIHNTLEPIAFGVPVIFGAKYKKFPEAVTLVKNGGAFSIKNKVELAVIFRQLEEDVFYKNASEKAVSYLNENKGATERILQVL